MSSEKNKKNAELNWVRRNAADEPRLNELVEMYKSLGFEVMVKDFTPEENPDECSECMIAFPGRCKVIYTRKKARNSRD